MVYYNLRAISCHLDKGGLAMSDNLMNKELSALIRKAAETLKSFGATEVYLFGSMAKGANTEHSDIDLAVSGLPPKVFFKAMGSTLNILKREFDLVDLDEQTPFNDYLKSHGELKRVV